MLPTFLQNLTLQEAFETVAQINIELKRMELDGVICKKINFLVDKFSSLFAKHRKTVEK